MKQRTAGDSHHLYELQQLERLIFSAWDFEGFYKNLLDFLDSQFGDEPKTFTVEDLRRIDQFTRKYFEGKLPENELWIVRAFLVGKLISEREISPLPSFQRVKIEELPARVRDAARNFHLSPAETKALEWTVNSGALRLTTATGETISRVQNVIFESVKNRETTRELRRKLEDEFFDTQAEINRNWNRVAITEINSAFNMGYLAQISSGNFVLGFSMADACDHCKALIDGKVYAVINPDEAQSYDSLAKDSEEYKRQVWLHENAVWVGKDNVGRSGSTRKKIDKTGGTSPENLTDRQHHEIFMPAIPMHPHCRCRWIRLHPTEQYVDSKGELQMRVTNEQEWQHWFNKRMIPFLDKLNVYGLSAGRM